MNIFEEVPCNEANYPFTIKPNFSTLGSIVEISRQGLLLRYLPIVCTRDLLGFNATTLYEEYILSPNPVDILLFDNNFLEIDIAQGMIFKGNRSAMIHNFKIDVHPGYKDFEKFRGGVQWHMMESKDNISGICCKLKNENNQLVSFNGQSISFELSIKKT